MKVCISCKKFLIKLLLIITFLIVVSAFPSLSKAATIIVVNLDGSGEGFNDATPFTPVGGNPATTLGQARLNAFQYAADIWSNILDSNVEILVGANFNPLICNESSATLGGAGAISLHRNFTGAPVANTWYPQALANALNGSDLYAGVDDIGATFNSNIDNNNSCLSGTNWYYGYDRNGDGQIDFVSVALHEIGHGLGFQTFVNLATGVGIDGHYDTYMLNLEHHDSTPSDFPSMTNAQRMTASRSGPDLHWTGINVQGASGDKTAGVYGTHVQMYGPNPAESGSSVSHFNTAVAPDELMEPFYTGPNHHPGLTVELFQDIGWQLNPEYCPNLPVGIVDVPPVYYTVLQDAYDAMVSGDTIQSQAIVFIENLLIDMNISVTLNGGYDCDYNDPPSGETTLNGNMTISDGTLIIEDGTFTVH